MSLLVVGLPVLLSEFKTDLALGSWVITVHRLALVSLLAPIGKLSDIHGRVKLYTIGYFIFAVGALLSAFSPSIYHLMGFRLIQGIGGAFMFVNSIAMVTDAFADKGLGTGIGINQVAINAGTVTGYTLSGVVISLYGWRTLFLIDALVGFLGGLWAKLRLREDFAKINSKNEVKFDWKGAVTFSTTLLIVLYVLTMGSKMPSQLSALLIVQSMILFSVFVWIEKNTVNPMIDLKLFKIRTFTIGNFSNFLNGITFASLALLASLYLEVVEGFTPMQAGLTLIPLDLTLIIIGPLSGWLSDRIGTRILTTTGLVVSGISLLILSNITLQMNYILLLTGLIVAGLGVGMFRSPNASSVMGAVPPDYRGVAAGVRSTILNMSMALSTPFAVAIIYLTTSISDLPLASISSELTTQMEVLVKNQLTLGIRNTLIISAIINFIAAIISYLREEELQKTRVKPSEHL